MVWTTEQKQFLIDNHKTMFYKDIGEELGKKKHTVETMGRRLGLTAPRRLRPVGLKGKLNPNYKHGKTVGKWDKSSPEKRYARKLVERAILKGTLVKPTRCTICMKLGRIEAHHEDYTKPLDIKWMCSCCHRKYHAGKL